MTKHELAKRRALIVRRSRVERPTLAVEVIRCMNHPQRCSVEQPCEEHDDVE